MDEKDPASALEADAQVGSAVNEHGSLRTQLFAIIFVLAVPLVALGVSEAIQARMNSRLRSAIRTRYPEADPSVVATITVARLVEEYPLAFAEFRGTLSNLDRMTTTATATAVLGVILLGGVWVLGLVSRLHRRLLLLLFRPGLYLAVIALIGLILAHGALAIGTIYYGESALIGRVHIGLIVAIGIGAVVGILLMAHGAFALVRTVRMPVIGVYIEQNSVPILWESIKRIADELNALVPEHLVVGLDPTFFVTEANVVCLNGSLPGRTLYCSLPLCRILTRDEFLFVIGHELGHFKGLDTRFSQKFFPVYRGTASAISSLFAAGGEGGAGTIALLPAVVILTYFLRSFSIAESFISRSRELVADRIGATTTNTATAGSALVKVHAFGPVWDGVREMAVAGLKQGKQLINASKAYAAATSTLATADVLRGIAETRVSHPTDSHPPLGVRLEAMGVSITDLSEAALNVNPSQPAIDLFSPADAVEENVSNAYQAMLAQQLDLLKEPDVIRRRKR